MRFLLHQFALLGTMPYPGNIYDRRTIDAVCDNQLVRAGAQYQIQNCLGPTILRGDWLAMKIHMVERNIGLAQIPAAFVTGIL
jgi:hypothetical protein